MACKTVRREFTCSRWGFHYDQPRDFSLGSWQKRQDPISGWYILYRWLAASFFLSVLVANGSLSTDPDFWFIYLTHLGFILQTLNLAVSAFVPLELMLLSQTPAVQQHREPPRKQDRMTPLTKISWFLYNSTNLLTIVITVIYWVALYTPGSQLEVMNFLVHGFNSIMSVLDVFAGRRPCRLLHFYHPMVVLLAYVAFSVLYWVADGRDAVGLSYIYPVLNWENLALTVPFVVIGFFVALPIVHCLFWLLHQLRDRVCGNQEISLPDPTQGIENAGFDEASL